MTDRDLPHILIAGSDCSLESCHVQLEKGKDMRRTRVHIDLFVCLIVIQSSACFEVSDEPVLSPPGTQTTVILVRHAERDPGVNPPPDLPINEEGFIRAAELKEVLLVLKDAFEVV